MDPYTTFGCGANDPVDLATWRRAFVSFAMDRDSIERSRHDAGHGVEIEL